MVDLKLLTKLVRLMKLNDLREVDLQDADQRILLKRGAEGVIQPVVAPMQPAAAPEAVAPAPAAADTSAPAAANNDMEGLVEITSPMVGSFYTAPSPDSPDFVTVGSTIDAETVVCLIEAMKVFNDIKAEVSGTIEKILVSSGQAVEFGEPLFLVRPA